jgi:predicted nuclease of restriction endonuclease-like (RecB) superfamily
MDQLPSAAPDFFSDVRSILAAARSRAATAVNTAMVEAYWLIGKRIVEEEQQGQAKATYGERLLEELSRHLGDQFGKGFSVANLRNFRQFYLTYPDQKGIHYTLCSELSWSHNRLIMREEDEKAQLYYLKQAKAENWSVRQLQRQLKTRSYQRLLASRESPPAPPATTSGPDIRSLINDPYVLEFLQLPEPHDEADVESAIISQLQQFLLEMGHGFSFVARQMRISTETSHFYLDLVFYHYLLKCFVVIDLKTEKLTHQHIGQMDMYVRMFDDLKRGPDDNPTLGIILCSDKDETVVHYSVLKDSEQLFASKYRTLLPTEEELAAEIERERQLIEHRRQSES